MKKNKLEVLINNEVILDFDRAQTLPDYQENYLKEMDEGMDNGIPVADDVIKSPGMLERSQYVTHSLIDALLSKNNDGAQAMCAYLATRVPELLQVQCTVPENNEGISVKLIYKQDTA